MDSRWLSNSGMLASETPSSSGHAQVREDSGESLFGPGEARFHRTDRDVELLRHSLIGAFELIAESQEGLRLGGELFDGRLKLAVLVFEEHLVFGGFGVTCGDGVLFQQFPLALAFADEFQRQTDGDAEQPGSNGSLPSEAGGLFPYLEVHLLGDVFDVLPGEGAFELCRQESLDGLPVSSVQGIQGRLGLCRMGLSPGNRLEVLNVSYVLVHDPITPMIR